MHYQMLKAKEKENKMGIFDWFKDTFALETPAIEGNGELPLSYHDTAALEERARQLDAHNPCKKTALSAVEDKKFVDGLVHRTMDVVIEKFGTANITCDKFRAELQSALDDVHANTRSVLRYAEDAQDKLVAEVGKAARENEAQDRVLAGYFRSTSPVEGNPDRWSSGLDASLRLSGTGGYDYTRAAMEDLRDIPYLSKIERSNKEIADGVLNVLDAFFREALAESTEKLAGLEERVKQLANDARFYRGSKDFSHDDVNGTGAFVQGIRDKMDAARDVIIRFESSPLFEHRTMSGMRAKLARLDRAASRIAEVSETRFAGSDIARDRFLVVLADVSVFAEDSIGAYCRYVADIDDAEELTRQVEKLAEVLEGLVMELDAPGSSLSGDGYFPCPTGTAAGLSKLAESVPLYNNR